jgi:hypothetical protein
MIFSYIDKREDLLGLCLASHALFAVSRICLYKSLNIIVDFRGRQSPTTAFTESRFAKLHRTLRSQDIACLVTDFRIQWIRHCWGGGSKTGRICKGICNRFDTMLGQVLLSLENLQVFHFCYQCCLHVRQPGHQYLERLSTRQLRQFKICCYSYSLKHIALDIPQLLTSPYLATVTSLSLPPFFKPMEWGILSANDSLPHLKKLVCSDLELIEVLLPRRTITHLRCPIRSVDFNQLHRIIQQNPCSLTHLDIPNPHNRIMDFIAANPSPYQSLKHLAEFNFRENEVRFRFIFILQWLILDLIGPI